MAPDNRTAGRVGRAKQPAARAWVQEPELVARGGIGAAVGAGGEGDGGARSRRPKRRRGDAARRACGHGVLRRVGGVKAPVGVSKRTWTIGISGPDPEDVHARDLV